MAPRGEQSVSAEIIHAPDGIGGVRRVGTVSITFRQNETLFRQTADDPGFPGKVQQGFPGADVQKAGPGEIRSAPVVKAIHGTQEPAVLSEKAKELTAVVRAVAVGVPDGGQVQEYIPRVIFRPVAHGIEAVAETFAQSLHGY